MNQCGIYQSVRSNRRFAFLDFLVGTQGVSEALAWGVALDQQGNAYTTGRTNSTNVPITPNAFQPRNTGSYHASFPN